MMEGDTHPNSILLNPMVPLDTGGTKDDPMSSAGEINTQYKRSKTASFKDMLIKPYSNANDYPNEVDMLIDRPKIGTESLPKTPTTVDTNGDGEDNIQVTEEEK